VPVHTFVFTDIEGSTRLWVDHPTSASAAISLHDQILATVFERSGGRVVKNLGDGLLALFSDPQAAIEAAAVGQFELASQRDALGGAASVRMAVHSGDADIRGDDVIGLEVNRCQRIMATAHGGQVVVSAATADLIGHQPNPPLTLVDLGRYRLRDLDDPQQIYQLAGPRLQRDFPPLDSPTTHSHNLPAEMSSFVGRTEELAAIDKLVHASRLVTLTGEGGVGKTRLALKVASMLRGRFPDGIWVIDLSAAADDAEVAVQVASGIETRPSAGTSARDAVISSLAPLTTLVILDNCEHVLAGVVDLVEHLLTRGPAVNVLTTSRERIGLPGEVVHRVPPMPFPDTTVPPSAAARYDAIRLFVERAALVAPSFRLTEDNVGDVTRICAHLDGLPLAIELAAATSASLTPADMVDGLARTLDLLDRQRQDRGRHGTLRAAARWSFDLLSPPEQRLFATLSVFHGGFEPAAVAAVTDDDERGVLARLASLADKSLVRRAPESRRFRMLEPLRAFAAEQLDADATSRSRSNHARFFAGLADRAHEARDGAELGEWLDRLDSERDNLHAAFEAANEAGEDDVALRIAIGATVLWKQRGQGAEGRRRLERALSGQRIPPDLRARGHLACGDLAADIGDIEAARHHLDTALHLAQELDDTHTAAWSLARLASIPHKEGDLGAACELFEEALASARAAGDDLVLSHVLASLSLVVADRGDVVRAMALATEGVERSRATGNTYAIADALLAVGEVGLNHGDPAEARERVEEALEIGTQEGLGSVIAWSLAYLGRTHLVGSELQAARVILEKALEEFGRVGSPMGRPWVARHLALVDWWGGDNSAAEARLRLALADAVVYVVPEAPLVVEFHGWILATDSPRDAAVLLGCAGAHLGQMGLVLPRFEATHAAVARRQLSERLSASDLNRLSKKGANLGLTEAAELAAARNA
jgi:predicted ATPase/class 3 adenylate cyclase